MNIKSCKKCGVLIDFDVASDIYGKKFDYYGQFTKCGNCGYCVYEDDDVDAVPTKFEDTEN